MNQVVQDHNKAKSNSPDVEQGGKGGHVEGKLGVAPVQHVLGHHGDQEDPFDQSASHMKTLLHYISLLLGW